MSSSELGMSNNGDVNPCRDLCKGSSCCRNIRFFLLDKDDFTTLTQKTTLKIKLNSSMDMPPEKEFRFLRNGVYYANKFSENNYTAVIVGPCANLGEMGECTIYEERPLACRRFKAGGKECDKIRKRDRLKPIQELIQLYPRA